MTVATKKSYRATFILDTRGREESVDQLIEDVKKETAAAGAEVIKAENLGRRDFARRPDPKVPAGNYLQLDLAGPAGLATVLREHFRLNPTVYRLLVQSL
jgi:small subunit ribosomal protein S6